MLAPLGLQATEQTQRVYSGFPWWHVLLIEPNREQKSAEWLRDNADIHVYLPTFSKKQRCRGKLHRVRLCPAIPGMLFVPEEIVDIPRRREVFDYAHVTGFIKGSEGKPRHVSKADIELIRLMEARLNLAPDEAIDSKGQKLKIGAKVEFVDPLFAYSWGESVVVEVASENRIGIEVASLFGRSTKVYVPASEIEVM